jgi:hypothetical protein
MRTGITLELASVATVVMSVAAQRVFMRAWTSTRRPTARNYLGGRDV